MLCWRAACLLPARLFQLKQVWPCVIDTKYVACSGLADAPAPPLPFVDQLAKARDLVRDAIAIACQT